MKSILSDQELLVAFKQGDNSAMDIIIARYHKKVLGYIRRTVKDSMLAEDLCQETFIKAINSLKRNGYQDDGRFAAWLFRIAHNLIVDQFRNKAKLPTTSNEVGDVDLFNNARYSDDTIETKNIKLQINADLKKLIYELPEEQKNTIIMRLNFDMSFKEIAKLQDISINTALGRMRYAIINLRKMIEEKNIIVS